MYTRDQKWILETSGVKTLTGLKCVRKEPESEVFVKMFTQLGF